MQYSEWVQVAAGAELKTGRTALINSSTVDSLLLDDTSKDFFDIKLVITGGMPTEGSLIGVHLKYIDEPMPRAKYNPRYRGRVMTDNRLGTYHSIDQIKIEKDMQLCLHSSETATSLTMDVYIRAKG